MLFKKYKKKENKLMKLSFSYQITLPKKQTTTQIDERK